LWGICRSDERPRPARTAADNFFAADYFGRSCPSEPIPALYNTVSIQTGSPIVELNRAIAVAELDGPRAAERH
jgi:RNA polymerase sigma-70 factor (ECF subfamily)